MKSPTLKVSIPPVNKLPDILATAIRAFGIAAIPFCTTGTATGIYALRE